MKQRDKAHQKEKKFIDHLNARGIVAGIKVD